MATQHIGFANATVNAPPNQDSTPTVSQEMDAAAKAGTVVVDVDERRLRRRIANRESARRCRARKQRRVQDLLARAARLEGARRELTVCAQAAGARLALVRLANAGLCAEAAALTRRLSAARRALALRGLYAAAMTVPGEGSSFGPLDIEQTIASLIA